MNGFRSLWFALQELPFGPKVVSLGLVKKIIVGMRLGSLQQWVDSQSSNDQSAMLQAQRGNVVLQLQATGLDEAQIQVALQEYDAVIANSAQQQNEFAELLNSENYKEKLNELLVAGVSGMIPGHLSPTPKFLHICKESYTECVRIGVYTQSKVFVEINMKNMFAFANLPF